MSSNAFLAILSQFQSTWRMLHQALASAGLNLTVVIQALSLIYLKLRSFTEGTPLKAWSGIDCMVIPTAGGISLRGTIPVK